MLTVCIFETVNVGVDHNISYVTIQSFDVFEV